MSTDVSTSPAVDEHAGLPTCSVVIAAYQRPILLQRLIDGLAEQSVQPAQVIVVDDGSATPLAPEFPTGTTTDWSLIRTTNGGAGSARHHGIGAATGDVIVIIDDDMVVPPGLVESHLDAHRSGAAVVQGRFANRDDGDRPLFDDFIDSQQQRYFDACADDDANVEPVRFATGNVSFSRQLYLDVGGFDTEMTRREDSEIGLRMAATGAVFGFADAAAEHDEPAESLERWLEVSRQYGHAEVDIYRRHPDHSPWELLDQMPGPIRLMVKLLGRTPRTMRGIGRVAAKAGSTLERTGRDSISVRCYGAGYALHWFAGVHESFGPAAAVASRRARASTSAPNAATLAANPENHMPHAVRFGKIDIDVMEVDAAVDAIIDLTDTGRVELVVTPNVDHVVRINKDKRFEQAYERASLRLADGQPLVMTSRLLRLPLKTKLSGSDLLEPVLRGAAEHGTPVFLLGASDESALAAETELRSTIPGLDIVGRASPMYTPDEPLGDDFKQALDDLRASGARLVILAFGSPKQEILVDHLADQLPAACYCCFGASLDFASGAVSRAPRIASKLGIEWLWRLALEPRRLWRRYLIDDIKIFPIFVRMTADRLRGRSLVIESPTLQDAPT